MKKFNIGSNSEPDKGSPPLWFYKKESMVWKLCMLLLVGLCGICVCLVCIKQTSYYQNLHSIVGAASNSSGRTSESQRDLFLHYPQPLTYGRRECTRTPVHYFVILSMQRTGSGWLETLLNNHPNISSHGEVFALEARHENFTMIKQTLDTVYNLDWFSSSAKKECTAAVGFKWMLNQGAMEYNKEIATYFRERGVSVIFLFRRNILKRYVSILANIFDRDSKLLNGTHRAHVHSRMEADILAAYKPIVNVNFLPSYLQHVEVIMNDALSYFKDTRHIILYYEDLVKDPEKIKGVQKFLGLEPRKVESQLVKIHTKALPEQIQNWEDVYAKLKDTKFSFLLEDTDYM